jgi:AbrB family transcriptional regulator (stage V sporulation protein T)
VACSSGATEKEMVGQRISAAIENVIDSRKLYTWQKGDEAVPVAALQDKYYASAVMPIFSDGSISGAIAVLNESANEPSETEVNLLQTAALFLGKHLES